MNKKEHWADNVRYEQKFYALFATQNGNSFGGDFSLTYVDEGGNTKHTLPWLMPHKEDMKIFKLLTVDNIVVMGFNTFKSLDLVPLKNRINIVVASRPYHGPCLATPPWEKTQLFFVATVDEAIALARDYGGRDVFFIGGKTILDEVLTNHGQLLDGFYHSKISADWPSSAVTGQRNTINMYFVPGTVENYRITAQKIGMQNGIGPTVRCSFWKRSSIPQSDISVSISVLDVYEDVETFYRPSPEQQIGLENRPPAHTINVAAESEVVKVQLEEGIGAKLINLTDAFPPPINTEKNEVASETVEALANIMSTTAIEKAIKTPNVLERDRGMAVVDLEAYDKAATEATASKESLRLMFEKSFAAKTQEEKSAPADKDATPVVCSDFVGVAKEIGELLVIKDAAYGSAFEKTKEIFKILFPAGLPMGAYDDALTIMRILDKICRLGVLCTNPEENKTSERTEDAWKDIAGYAIKALSAERKRNNKETKE